MSVRINKAKNFKGKAYVAADELDSLIQTMTFGTALTGTSVDGWKVNFQYADQTGTNTKTAVDLTAIKEYIDGKAINVDAGAGITIDTSNPLAPVIAADIDSATVVWSGTGTTAKLATGLKLVKKTTANTGFAASYQLCDNAGTAITGSADINIFKDQFLKDAVFGWANGNDSSASGFAFQTTKDSTYTVPTLRFDVYTYNQNTGDDSSSDADALYKSVYIDCTTFYNDYVGSSGVDITNNVVKGVVDTTNSEKVYTAKGTSVAVLSVGASGFKVANIQNAINNAVTAEHNTASAAIEDLEGDVKSFASNTSAAVTVLNTRIETVATNAATAAGNAQANAVAYASGVADNAQSAVQKVGSAVDALDTRVSAAIGTINTNVENAIDTVVTNVNTAISANVSRVNSSVDDAITAVNTMVSGSVDNVNTNVTSFKNTVSATVQTVSAAMESLAGDVNDAVTARNTQLTNAVEVVESSVTIASTEYATNSGVITKTVNAKYILAVYDASGNQIYPEISRGDTATNGVYAFTLEADYGASPAAGDQDATWNVICVKPLPEYTGSAAAVTGYSNTIAYTNASKAEDATYASVTKVDATAVDATDVTYTKGTAVAATTVGKGTAGSAATTVANGTAATAPVTTGIAVEKDVPAYQNEA
jgi:hypothetical protein